MPAPANTTEFLEVVRKSGLVPDDQLRSELAHLRTIIDVPQSIDQLAAVMVRDGLLTRFQAKQIKVGRYKRFEIAGKYRLLELLGVGGMGAVYLCEHVFMKRLVAIKVLPTEKMREQSAVMRFYREARAVAALDHPNIVRAHDIDKSDGLHFLVMEYVDGASLQEVVARHGPLDPARAAHYAAQAAHGLHHAHQLGMVHRDIKPGNLLLERTGVVKLLDMGLARFFDQTHDNLTEKFDNKCVLGTADYLAPEQAVSNVVDIRADIYALGGSLYFFLTGQSPFPDGTIAAKLMAHQSREPRPVTAFRSDVPPELLAVLGKMMRKHPADRYQTPAELYDALAPWAALPLPPPPTHEMPELCPAVLALTGHAVEKARSGPARLVVGTGSDLNLFRGPGSSGVVDPARPHEGTRGSHPLYPTASASGAPTQPLGPIPAAATGDSTVPFRPHPESSADTLHHWRPAGPRGWALTGLVALAAAVAAGTLVFVLGG
ncbi:MAG TPA: serine/threonine-protein kinase [Fimbriiglobus sp.]|nr:serine/threonine-protein kinase [Fimbriiglobus sp.]